MTYPMHKHLVRFLPLHSPRVMGMACAMFAVLVWSGWMVLSSYGVRGHLNAYDITALRFATAALCLLPFAIKRGLRIGPYGHAGALLLALLMGGAYNVVAINGMKLASTAHASIIQTTVLILSTLGAVWVLREKFTRLQGVGVALSVLGIVCLLESGGGGADEGTVLQGHLLFMGAGAMWALYLLLVRKWQADALQTAAAVSCISALYFLPIYFLFLPHQITWEHWPEAAFQAFYQGLINSVLALICYNRAVHYLGAATTSAFLPLIPVIATLMAMPLLGEYPNWVEWGGLGLAAFGVIMATGMLGRLLNRRPLP